MGNMEAIWEIWKQYGKYGKQYGKQYELMQKLWNDFVE